MKNLGKNGWNDFPLFPATRIGRSRGGTVDWNDTQETLVPQAFHVERPAPQGSLIASVGGRSVPKFFLRGKAGTIRGKRLPSKGNDRPAGTGRVVINVPD